MRVEVSEQPANRTSTSFEDVYTLHYGKALPKTARTSGGAIQVFGSSGVVGSHTERLVVGPAIIVGRKGSAGAVFYAHEDFWPIDTTYFVKPPSGIELRFAYYHLIALQLSRLEKSTAIPGLSRDDAYALQIAIPPRNEQRRIVAKIEGLFFELDKGVENLTTAREKLKVYREAVLQRCFLSVATREYPLSNTALPPFWRWEKLSVLATLITKGASPKWQGINYVQDAKETLFVTSENVRSNYMDLEKPKFVQNVFNEGQRRSVLKSGDLLFNIVGASIGRAAIFDDDRRANINQAVALVRIEKRAIAEYATYFLNSALGQSSYMGKRVEVARANLSLKDVGDIEVPLPPPSQIQSVVDFIKASLSRIDVLKQELYDEERRADALRQAILKKAFSGQLVAQDSRDEPASALLERICAERDESGTTKRRNKKNTKMEAA